MPPVPHPPVSTERATPLPCLVQRPVAEHAVADQPQPVAPAAQPAFHVKHAHHGDAFRSEVPSTRTITASSIIRSATGVPYRSTTSS